MKTTARRGAKETAMNNIIEMNRGIQCITCGVVNWPTAPRCMRCNTTLGKRAPQQVYSNTTDGSMTFSQSLARVFEVIDYALLLPAGYGLLLSLLFIASAPWFSLIILVWFAAGCWLLRGFFLHSRGRLNNAQVYRLWAATIGYNMIDLIFTWTIASYDNASTFYYLGLWPLLVVVFSGIALISESRRNQSVSYY
ncbi:MAG: hypothetical protein ICV68_09145 [Pyrinomonadaceae bacterium]|nr:hypothetical protein [Pyrinomonadaceae bacterium]